MNEEKIGKLKNWSRISIKGEVQYLKKKKKKTGPTTQSCKLLNDLADKAKNLGYKLVENMEVIDDEEEEAGEKTFSSAVYQ
jgi:hypothetical protein